MTVTSYENDPRVVKVHDYHYVVTTDEDRYDVMADAPTQWFAAHALGSPRIRAANLRSLEDAEAWAQANPARGPFTSAEIALYELLGPARA